MGLFDHERELARERWHKFCRWVCRNVKREQPPMNSVPTSSADTAPVLARAADWYWHHFLKGVCFHLPLVVLVVALPALPFNVFGEGVGVAQLIWHVDDWKRFLVGAALTVLALEALFVSYVLWYRAWKEKRIEPPGPFAPIPFHWFVARVLACALATVAVPLLLWEVIRATDSTGVSETGTAVWAELAGPPRAAVWLPLGAVAAVALAVLGAWLKRELLAVVALVYGDKRRVAKLPLIEGVRRRLGAHKTGTLTALAVGWSVGAVIVWGWGPVATGTAICAAVCLALSRWPVGAVAFGRVCASVLMYLLVTFALSTHGWAAGLVSALAAAASFFALVTLVRWPKRGTADNTTDNTTDNTADNTTEARRGLWARFADWVRGSVTRPKDVPDPSTQWPGVLATGLAFFLLCNVPSWASPAPIVCFFLFGLVVVYGMATVVVRRAVPVVLVALVVGLIGAGSEPYKFRYDGHRDGGGAWVPGLDYAPGAWLRLNEQVRADFERQRAYDNQLTEYEAAIAAEGLLTHELDAVALVLDEGGGIWKQRAVDVARRRYEALVREHSQAQAHTKLALRELARLWALIETKNRVAAGRSERSDLPLPFLTKSAPESERALLPVRDWDLSEHTEPGPLVLVAVSGGGLRSAAWTFTVLRALEERFAVEKIDFPKHVRLITGASGGMLGAAYYTVTLPAARRLHEADYWPGRAAELKRLFENLTRDDLTALVKQQVYEDVPNLFSPWPARNDRGKELERAWARNMSGALDVTFDDLRAGRRPALVFTPHDGRRRAATDRQQFGPAVRYF
jgi:hypothetical protein